MGGLVSCLRLRCFCVKIRSLLPSLRSAHLDLSFVRTSFLLPARVQGSIYVSPFCTESPKKVFLRCFDDCSLKLGPPVTALSVSPLGFLLRSEKEKIRLPLCRPLPSFLNGMAAAGSKVFPEFGPSCEHASGRRS